MSAPTTEPRFRILWLVCVHFFMTLVLLAVLEGNQSAGEPLVALRIGLILSQAAMLGIWVEAGRGWWSLRLLGCLFCVAWLGLPVTLVLVSVAAVLFVARCCRVHIHRDTDEPAAAPQFYIRHLLILTLLIACLLALGRPDGPAILWRDWYFWPLLAAPFAVISVMAIWSTLAPKHPAAPIAVVFGVAVAIGLTSSLIIPWLGGWTAAGLGTQRLTPTDDAWLAWLIATSTHTLSLVVSLLLIRSCGYQLRRWPAPLQQRDSEGTNGKE